MNAALVLETHNLQDLRSMQRLLAHLAPQLAPLAEVVVTHDGWPLEDLQLLREAAGRELVLLELAAGADYYEAKNQGFDATTAPLVAFGDADCWPSPDWVEALLAPFADPNVQVTAGRTTYRSGTVGSALTAVDFLYFPSPFGPGCTRNFYANNVAFRREIFATRRYPRQDGVHKGHCQVLGMQLVRDGIPVRYVHGAHTVHRLPDSRREWMRTRYRRGRDTRALAPAFARGLLPSRLAWLGRAGPLSLTAMLGARLGYGLWVGVDVRALPVVVGVTAADWLGGLT